MPTGSATDTVVLDSLPALHLALGENARTAPPIEVAAARTRAATR